MPNFTTRRGLAEPITSDSTTELRLAITANAVATDGDVRYFSGTISNRSTVDASPLAGDLYYGTDTGLLYEYNGTAWGTVLVAGAWVPLTLASGWIFNAAVGTYTPSARLVGDTVQLKGAATNNTGGSSSIFVGVGGLPTFARPPASAVGLYQPATSNPSGITNSIVGIFPDGHLTSPACPTGARYISMGSATR